MVVGAHIDALLAFLDVAPGNTSQENPVWTCVATLTLRSASSAAANSESLYIAFHSSSILSHYVLSNAIASLPNT